MLVKKILEFPNIDKFKLDKIFSTFFNNDFNFFLFNENHLWIMPNLVKLRTYWHESLKNNLNKKIFFKHFIILSNFFSY